MSLFHLAITGHRPDKLGGYAPNHLATAVYARMREVIELTLQQYPGLILITGGALGTDQEAAKQAIQLGIPFWLYAPCYNQDSKWPQSSRIEYKTIIDKASKIKYIFEGEYPGAWCMQQRNEQMVNDSDGVLAIWDGSSGGTHNCVTYARKMNKRTYTIDPNLYK
jgi:uncharacterized phage-like protein YoqJ